jgi:hypothetical protein
MADFKWKLPFLKWARNPNSPLQGSFSQELKIPANFNGQRPNAHPINIIYF